MLKLNKILLILLLSIFSLALDDKNLIDNDDLIQTLNDAKELNIDFMCYNMCKDTTKGMNILELEKFCTMSFKIIDIGPMLVH